MHHDRWERIQVVFHAVADLPPGDQRAALLRECDGDDELMRDVLRMLQADSSSASVLDQPLSQLADNTFDQPVLPPPGFRKVGPYEIQKVLGEGGMGTVFFAVREDLGTAAAIKILRDAWVSPARRERFAIEQYTLANLDHPNIARLLDANTLSDGTPFFVMEYVDGLHLDKYCETHRCSVTERLSLFRSVCKAVEFAHAHAVIHRDLKPSNVLVRADGEIKLLDFGVAKQLDQIGSAADHTRTGLRLLTPAFAAPEQIRGEPAAIGSDVYSLGVILYQLLAGRLPFDDRPRSPAEALASLTERQAVRPSLVSRRVAQHGSSMEPAVAARPSEWADLDVICLTAMHADVQKRYGSAEALIRDIDNYLRGEPLEARPDTLTYRLGKFVRRHRTSVAASATVVVTLAILISVFMTRLAAERNAALAEAARTQRIQQFTRNLFQGGDKDAGPANEMRVITLIDRGVQEARALDNDPEAQAELYQTLGEIYHKLGSLNQAEELFKSAISRRQAISGTNSAPVAESMTALALLRADQAKFDDAERLSRQALDISSQTLPPGHPGIAAATHGLGHVLEEKGSYNEAIPVLQRAVRLRSGIGQSESDLAASLYELANVYFYAGRYKDAEALNQRVLGMNRDIYGETHPSVAEVLVNLGAIQQDLGHYDKAEQFHRQALQITRSFYGENHYRTAAGFTMVARALVFQKRFDDAVELLNSALAVQERVFGPVHPRVASALNELGTVALQRGLFPEARAKFERMGDIYRSVYAGKHYLVGTAVSNLASAYMADRENSRAEGLFREAVSIFTATLSPDHLNTGIARIKLGRTLLRQKRYKEAQTETSAGFAILKKQMNPSASWLATAQADLVEIYTALGQLDKSAALRIR